MEISRYFASLGFRIDRKSVRQVDRTLRDVENRITKFGRRVDQSLNIGFTKSLFGKNFSRQLKQFSSANRLMINNFQVDQMALNRSLLRSFQVASLATPFEIRNFNVNQLALNRAIGRALDVSSLATTYSLERFNIDQFALNRQMTRALQIASLAASRATNLNPNIRGGADGRLARGLTGGHAATAGGIGGLAARGYLPLLALAGGGYGLAQTNKRNQEVVSAQLQSQAVVQQAGGTAEQGVASFDWLRGQGERIGFNYLQASGDYNNLLSGLTGAGMSVEQGQGVYKGFAELSRVNKLDAARQQRVFRALSQVAGKDQLMSEELKQQLAESLPGAVALFASAYQDQLAEQGKGGGLTGSDAIKALNEAMAKGQVKGDILRFAGARASARASSGIDAASRASQAEQARFQNRYNDLAIVASEGGLESGFARLFRSLSAGLDQSEGMVERLARGFDNLTKYVSYSFLTIQSLQRFFDGKDSYLGDKLFPNEESRQSAMMFFENMRSVFTQLDVLSKNIYKGWNDLFTLFDGSNFITQINNALSSASNLIGGVNALAAGDYSGAGELFAQAGKRGLNVITSPGRAGANFLLRAEHALASEYAPSFVTPGSVPYQFQPLSVSASDSQVDFQTKYQAEQRRLAQLGNYDLPGINKPLTGGLTAADLSITMDVNITAATPEDFNAQFQEKFKSVIESTLIQYSQKD